MSAAAISDRSLWLAHLRYCTRCPTDLCDRGEELAAAVRETLAHGETWQGIHRPLDGQLTLDATRDTR
jgi:hypothetical protein